MIINIRGVSGSGKTYAVREVMDWVAPSDLLQWQKIHDRDGKKVIAQVYHYNMQPIYVIGNYAANVCGGCDTIPTQDMVCSLVRHFSQFGHVIFEGLILSHSFSRYIALDEELTACGERYIWAFLDTPLDLCLERVQQRRDARGDTRPFNPKNTIDKYSSVEGCKAKVIEAGKTVITLDHENPAAQLMQLLIDDGQFNFSRSYREESFR